MVLGRRCRSTMSSTGKAARSSSTVTKCMKPSLQQGQEAQWPGQGVGGDACESEGSTPDPIKPTSTLDRAHEASTRQETLYAGRGTGDGSPSRGTQEAPSPSSTGPRARSTSTLRPAERRLLGDREAGQSLEKPGRMTSGRWTGFSLGDTLQPHPPALSAVVLS